MSVAAHHWTNGMRGGDVYLQIILLRRIPLRPIIGLVGAVLLATAVTESGHADSSGNPAVIVYDFRSGVLEWNGEWNTNGGKDDYRDYYRVDRLRGGYIIRNHRSFHATAAHDYFLEQINQIIKPYSECGFWDDENKNWIRKLLWSETDGWCGMTPHDWKYSLELEEGALMASMISGVYAMDAHCADELEYIHAHVNANGSIDDLTLETGPCEYGLLLSSLALGSRYFSGRTIIGHDALDERAYNDMKKAHHYIGKNLTGSAEPIVSTSYILRGFVNAYLTYRTHPGTDREQGQLLHAIEQIVSSYAAHQEPRGSFDIGSSGKERYPIQQQLKADIALMLTHRITGDASLLAAVKKNLDWVITDRWDRSEKCMGGIVWAMDDSTSFFECHQMWFLIAATYLQEATGCDYSMCRAEAFTFLTDDNFADIDLYDHNATRCGAFFAYRTISADGTIYKDPAQRFKGAYEIGASLWAMALNYDLFVEGHTRLITQPPPGESNGWDKAIFTECDFGSGNMVFQWDVQFMDASTEGAYTGLFNDQLGDWRVMFSTTSGLGYRTILDRECTLLDRSRLQSDRTYTIRITKSGANRATFVVLENDREIVREHRYDMKPFDACHFGVLQSNGEAVPSGTILVDNITYRQSIDAPRVNRLAQNFPNPFNATTVISFDIGRAGRVTLDIHDPAGRRIRRLLDATLARNNYTAYWDGTNERGESVSSGVYFYILRTETADEARTMVLIR